MNSCHLPGHSHWTKGGGRGVQSDMENLRGPPAMVSQRARTFHQEGLWVPPVRARSQRGTYHWPGPWGPAGCTERSAAPPWRLGTEGGRKMILWIRESPCQPQPTRGRVEFPALLSPLHTEEVQTTKWKQLTFAGLSTLHALIQYCN